MQRPRDPRRLVAIASRSPARARCRFVAEGRWSTSQNGIASRIGAEVLAAAATRSTPRSRSPSRSRSRTRARATSAAAASSSIGPPTARRTTYDFRETAPARPSPTSGEGDNKAMHDGGHLAVRRARHGRGDDPGLEGTRHAPSASWSRPRSRWRGTASTLSDGARALAANVQRAIRKYPASVGAVTKNGGRRAGET